MNNQFYDASISFFDIIELLRKKILVIISFSIFFAISALFINKFMITPTYSSTTKLYVIGSDTITSISDLQIGSSLTQDYIQLIQSRPVIQNVIDNLDLDYTYEQLLAQLKITNPTNTRMLNITISNHDPYLAKEIADEFATVSSNKIHELMLIEEPKIIETGVVNTTPISPNVNKNVLIWTILGVLIVITIIILSYIFDDTLKSDKDVETKLGLNTLAEIPLEEVYTPLFKDERLAFLNKPLEPLRKDLKKVCKKLPLAKFHFFKTLAKKLTKH